MPSKKEIDSWYEDNFDNIILGIEDPVDYAQARANFFADKLKENNKIEVLDGVLLEVLEDGRYLLRTFETGELLIGDVMDRHEILPPGVIGQQTGEEVFKNIEDLEKELKNIINNNLLY